MQEFCYRWLSESQTSCLNCKKKQSVVIVIHRVTELLRNEIKIFSTNTYISPYLCLFLLIGPYAYRCCVLNYSNAFLYPSHAYLCLDLNCCYASPYCLNCACGSNCCCVFPFPCPYSNCSNCVYLSPCCNQTFLSISTQ